MTSNVSMHMMKNPVTVQASDSIQDVLTTFQKSKKSHLLVEDAEGALKGVISKQDVFKVFDKLVNDSPGKTYSKNVLQHTTTQEIMTDKFLFVSPSDSVDYAVELLLQNEFHCVPVMDENMAVGIITAYDLLKAYYQQYG